MSLRPTVLILLACLTLSLHAEAKVTLALKASALVEGSRIRLGDVADHAESHRPQAEWTRVDLGSAPLSGYTAQLTRQEIERLLRAQGLLGEISLQGAAAVSLERASKIFDSAQIATLAKAYLESQLAGSVSRLELQLAGPLPDLQLPSGKVALKPRPLPSSQTWRRHATVWVDISIDDVFVRAIGVPFKVHAYQAALVAKQTLPAGSTPNCDVLQLMEVDLAALDGPALPADCQRVAGRLKRTLPGGTALLKTHLKHPSAVSQGENVNLQIRDGAVVLETLAVALNDGEVGQRIEVKPMAGTGLVVAEVIAPGAVKVVGK